MDVKIDCFLLIYVSLENNSENKISFFFELLKTRLILIVSNFCRIGILWEKKINFSKMKPHSFYHFQVILLYIFKVYNIL